VSLFPLIRRTHVEKLELFPCALDFLHVFCPISSSGNPALSHDLIPPTLDAFDCSLGQLAADALQIPKLLRAYLTLGAKICGPPALDRQFKTIDFLTLLDLNNMSPLARQRFLIT